MKITLPDPCSADWNSMEPRPGGRWCQECKKTLVDFAGMTRGQAKARLKLVRGNKICGRIAVHPDSGEVVFRPDPHRAARWAGGVVLVAALSSSGCGREEPAMMTIQPEIASIAPCSDIPMVPIEHWTRAEEETPLVTRAVPGDELEQGADGATPTAAQQLQTDQKQRRYMVRGRIGFH